MSYSLYFLCLGAILYIKLLIFYHGSFMVNIWIVEPVDFYVHDISETIIVNHIHTRLSLFPCKYRMLVMALILVRMWTGIT